MNKMLQAPCILILQGWQNPATWASKIENSWRTYTSYTNHPSHKIHVNTCLDFKTCFIVATKQNQSSYSLIPSLFQGIQLPITSSTIRNVLLGRGRYIFPNSFSQDRHNGCCIGFSLLYYFPFNFHPRLEHNEIEFCPSNSNWKNVGNLLLSSYLPNK